MDEHRLRRRLTAAIREAETAREKAEREGRPASRDREYGKVLAYRDVAKWLESEGE